MADGLPFCAAGALQPRQRFGKLTEEPVLVLWRNRHAEGAILPFRLRYLMTTRSRDQASPHAQSGDMPFFRSTWVIPSRGMVHRNGLKRTMMLGGVMS